MENLAYPIWLLSYYREAELRGADLLQRLLRKADDPRLQINLTRHLAKVKTLLQVLRPGIFTFFHIQGPVRNADRLTSIRLMAQAVVPAIREYAKEIDLPDPYERTPGEVRAYAGARRLPVVDREPLTSLGLV